VNVNKLAIVTKALPWATIVVHWTRAY